MPGLAYTSFAVRMLQGRDILEATAAALPAERLLDLTERFRAGGAQVDLSQLESHEPPYLARVRARAERAGLWLELSVPSSHLESDEGCEAMARIALALGVDRVRVALIYGRRYESFGTPDDWHAFVRRWRARLAEIRPILERQAIRVGIENHKDFSGPELADLLTALDSPSLGACIDFGNNIALLEDPLATIRTLAPFAVTTHLKDMAVRRYADGFELSEVPLGTGLVPLAQAVQVVRDARPDARLCLEMITRDPLKVPYLTERYWVAMDRPAPAALAGFERDVLDRARAGPLPRISPLPPADQLAAEDENLRESVKYAKDVLNL